MGSEPWDLRVRVSLTVKFEKHNPFLHRCCRTSLVEVFDVLGSGFLVAAFPGWCKRTVDSSSEKPL